MRAKRPYIVLSFRATVDAMAWEKRCIAEQIPGRLIPLPRELSAGCGLAWRMLPEDWERWRERFDPAEYAAAAQVEQESKGDPNGTPNFFGCVTPCGG